MVIKYFIRYDYDLDNGGDGIGNAVIERDWGNFI